MKDTLVIILLTYNHDDMIEKCLDMLLQQSYQDFKLCIFDDASKDGTPEILLRYKARFPEKIDLCLNPSNLGVLENFRKALKHIHDKHVGGYFLWACPDDEYAPEYTERCIQGLRSSHAVVSQSFIKVEFKADSSVRICRPPSLGVGDDGEVIFKIFERDNFQPFNQVIHGIIRFEFLEPIIPFQTWMYEDILLCELSIICLMKAYGGIHIVPEVLTTKAVNGRFEDLNPNDSFTKRRLSFVMMFLSCVKILLFYIFQQPKNKIQLIRLWKLLFNEYFYGRYKHFLKEYFKAALLRR